MGRLDSDSVLTVSGKCRSCEGLLSKYCVHVNVTPNFKQEMYIPLKRYQRKTLFVVGVSVDWATGRRWQTKLVDT